MHPHAMRRRLAAVVALWLTTFVAPAAQDLTLPNGSENLKFAVIGDSGTGTSSQQRVAERLIASRSKFPYAFALMMGDNLYGGSRPKDFERKFEEPYKPLLAGGLKFYAALGNHDDPNERY
jgi:hypothetical protein